ncbi:hypothetical protein BX616_004134, partial [Lobosporangium transversale]
MAALYSSSPEDLPAQTFLERKKPLLLPRQSTNDILSFTHIIADRLAPGQNIWDFFTPPDPSILTPTTKAQTSSSCSDEDISSKKRGTPTTGSPSLSPTKSHIETLALDLTQADKELNSSTNSTSTDVQPSSPTITSSSLSTETLSPPGPTNHTVEDDTPKTQKRRSFAQSFRDSMASLTQLLTQTSTNSSRSTNSTTSLESTSASSTETTSSNASSTKPFSVGTEEEGSEARLASPQYNILVLGSDSAPLASTLYKMSGLLPGATKVHHYQEISGFFVAYFNSYDSSSEGQEEDEEEEQNKRSSESMAASEILGRNDIISTYSYLINKNNNSNKERSEEVLLSDSSSTDGETDSCCHSDTVSIISTDATSTNTRFSKEGCDEFCSIVQPEPEAELTSGQVQEGVAELLGSDDYNNTQGQQKEQNTQQDNHYDQELKKPSPNTNLSIHAFSLDTTWPVPRTLAQRFWFPFAHGIVYIVDATRKNDPRGIDHLIRARQFLASLIADPHFSRKDIPVVIFANKAGTDPETCYRLDEIAEILGCGNWDIRPTDLHDSKNNNAVDKKNGEKRRSSWSEKIKLSTSSSSTSTAASTAKTRPWCVKSTRADGNGDGIRESI